MSASQPALFNVQEFTDNGITLVGGRLYTYAHGTTALKVAYTDPEGSVPQTYTADGFGGQYIALNARGELPTSLYLAPGSYDIALKRADGSTVWTRATEGVADASNAIREELNQFTASMATAAGSRQTGLKMPGANSPVITVERALTESISLIKYGGKDDFDGTTGTDNLTPILRILAEYPQGIQIDLPYTDTGTYRFGYFEANLLNGFTLNPAPGVILRFPEAWPINMAGVGAARPVDLYFETLKYKFSYSPFINKTELEKTRWLDAGALDQSNVRLAYTNGLEAEHVRMSWPDGPFTAIVPVTPNGYDVEFAPQVGGGNLDLTLFPAIGGTEISTCVKQFPSFGAGALLAVCVRLVDGHIVAVCAPGLQPTFSVLEKIGSAPFTAHTYSYKGSTTHASYSWDKSMLTVRTHNPRSFSILLNGMEIYYHPDTHSDIIATGFGSGFNTTASTLTLASWTRSSRKPTSGKRAINVMIVGDSITDPIVHGTWPKYMAEALENAMGFRVDSIVNLAVSGDTSAQQLVRLQAAATGGIDALLIMVGTNDIQGAVSVGSYLSNIDQMLTIAANNKMIPVVGLPPMFYGRAQAILAGGLGGDALNYESGGEHRTALLHWLAAHAIKPVTATLEDLGPILSNYLNQPPKDSVIRDNIHPTAYGYRLLGYAWAKALAGALNPAVHRSMPRQPILAAWAGAVANMAMPGNEVQFSVDNSDRVAWSGWCKLNGVATPGLQVNFAQLPRALWPDGVVRVTATATSSVGAPIAETVTIFVTIDGVMQVWFSSATPGGFYIDGLNYTRAFTQLTR